MTLLERLNLGKLGRRIRRAFGAPTLAVWYDARYRLPMASVEAQTGIEPRRADFVVGYLVDRGLLGDDGFRRPEPVSYLALRRVHSDRLLESLHEPEALARVFAVDPNDVHVDETLLTTRLACGATLAAARHALATGAPALNLLGGFHHAQPDRASALCPLNDIAVAIAALRSVGVSGQIAVIDLDAHPPDGTAACVAADPKVWIGSLSGCDWGPLPNVDETALPPGCDDGAYLAALDAMLARMPRDLALAFVIAGGDVLARDKLGLLGLTLDGALCRDRAVAAALEGVGSVWLPGGGYHPDAWRVLAGTAQHLATGARAPVADDFDPVHARYAHIAMTLKSGELSGQGTEADAVTMDDVLADLGVQPRRHPRLLGFYSASGIEHALERYGVLPHLRRLGFDRFEVELGRAAGRDRARLYGWRVGERHLLVELVAERATVGGAPVLYVHWLTLQDPSRPLERPSPLPGQEHPGLGLSKEFGELLLRMAARLELSGVAFAPSWYHMAYLARDRCAFVDPARQGRFEALVRDLGGMSLRAATTAVADKRVSLNGTPYAWEADDMVTWRDGSHLEPELVAAERDKVRFTVRPAPSVKERPDEASREPRPAV
jgi:acetoin utilization deacetylase AcuC-like enzyme